MKSTIRNILYHIKLSTVTVPNIIGTTLILFCFSYLPLNATHIVGGQLTYTWIAQNTYELHLVVRRDCNFGTEGFDKEAVIGIFYGDNQVAGDVTMSTVSMKPYEIKYIAETLDRFCVGQNDTACVEQASYRKTIYLRPDVRGYTLAYQRCCRNKSLVNIINPLDVGTTIVATIPSSEDFEKNSNPVFGPFPKIYTCVNEKIIFNHSATDADSGDHLVYKLCTPFEGKDSVDNSGFPDNPPFKEVTWKSIYNVNDMMGGVPLAIDSISGLMTATPDIIGQYVVGICVDEYRGGKFISTSRRDFEINVVPCGFRPKAEFNITSKLCDGYNLTLNNTSTTAVNYRWFFDFKNNQLLTDTNRIPNFTYTKDGTYEIVLVAINGSCTDTMRQSVNIVNPGLLADFDLVSDCNVDLKVHVTNKSQTNGTITGYQWTLTGSGNNLSSVEVNPIFSLAKGGNVTVMLTITDQNGCTAVHSKTIEANTLLVNLTPDSTICNGDSIRVVSSPNNNYTYNWSPTTGLNLSDPRNPIAKPNVTTTYKVTITGNNCVVEREITLTVRNPVNVRIAGDTATCNGNIVLVASSDSTKVFMWSTNPTILPVISNSDTLKANINTTTTYYVKAGDGKCPAIISRTVHNHSVNLEYSHSAVLCARDTFTIDLRNTDPLDLVKIQWEPNPIILSPLDQLNAVIFIPTPGRYVLRFTANNQLNCSLTDSIVLTAVEPPVPNINVDYHCGALTVNVSTTGGRNVSWDFGDGKGKSNEAKVSYTYDKSGRYKITLTIDSVCTRSATQDVIIVKLPTLKSEKITSCHGISVQLNPGGSPDYIYEWTPPDGLDNPNIANPTATVSKTTNYIVKIKDPLFPECEIFDSVTVFVPDEIGLQVNTDTVLCDAVNFTLRAGSAHANIKYQWCDKDNKPVGTGPEVVIKPEGVNFYFVKATDEFGCITSDTVHVNAFVFEGSIEGPEFICKGGTGILKLNTTPPGNYTYSWTPIANIEGSANGQNVTVKVDQTTTFTVLVNNGQGCEWTRAFTAVVNEINLSVTVDPATIVNGQTTQLNATPVDPTWTYKWSPDDGSLSDISIPNPIATPLKTTSYTVTVTDKNGCTATASITVTVTTCEDAVFIPNAFSPNDDTHNDRLYVRVRNAAVSKMEIIIYNRWGKEVYKSTNADDFWDGTYEGSLLVPDVFGYYLKFRCFEEKDFVKKGNINLIK